MNRTAMKPSRTLLGFTLTETAATIGLLGLVASAFGGVFASSAGLSAGTRARLLAEDDGRRSIAAVADALRGAYYPSLTGFGTNGGTSYLSFRRVLGSGQSDLVLDATESVYWRTIEREVDDVQSPGEVVLVKNGVTTVLAPRVPAGGFYVTRSGNELSITLTSYSSTSQRRVGWITQRLTVSIRN